MKHIKQKSNQELLDRFLECAICFWGEYGIRDDEDAVEINGKYISTYDKKLYDELKNNLVILEILKPKLYIEKGKGIFKGIDIIRCRHLGSSLSGKDLKKIKEWLEIGEVN